jgi:hypothetical protein
MPSLTRSLSLSIPFSLSLSRPSSPSFTSLFLPLCLFIPSSLPSSFPSFPSIPFSLSLPSSLSFFLQNAFLRLIRILRLFDAFSFVDQIAVTTELIVETGRQSGPVLSVFLFFAFITIILISGVIFVLEQGNFTVNAEYPQGQYLRPTLSGQGLEVSPFYSACISIYWTIITCTYST